MPSINRKSFHPIMRAALMIGFAFYILLLNKHDALQLYIAPHMEKYVKLSAIGLYVVGVYQAYRGLQALFNRSIECGCHPQENTLFSHGLTYFLIALPLLFGYLLPNSALNGTLAAKKGITLNPAAQHHSPAASGQSRRLSGENNIPLKSEADVYKYFEGDSAARDFGRLALYLYQQKDPILVKDEGYIEILSAIDLFTRPFVGRTMELKGFVYRDEQMPDNQFVIARFEMQCCSADAVPFGIIVESEQAKNLPNDTWVTVSGKIGRTVYRGNDLLKLQAGLIRKIAVPKSPYVYADYEYIQRITGTENP